MRKKIILVGALVALLAVPMVVNAAVEKYRYDNTQAWAHWTEIDAPVDGTVGWHFGYMSVYQYDSQFEDGVFADIYINDAYCPVGVEPYSSHGEHGEPNPNDPCEYSDRWGYSENATIEVYGKKLGSARVTGQFTLYGGHGGDPVGSPKFDVSLTGMGNTWTSQGMWRDRYSGGMSMYRDRWTHREATVTGFIGQMGFHPDRSGGGFGTSNGFSLWKSR